MTPSAGLTDAQKAALQKLPLIWAVIDPQGRISAWADHGAAESKAIVCHGVVVPVVPMFGVQP